MVRDDARFGEPRFGATRFGGDAVAAGVSESDNCASRRALGPRRALAPRRQLDQRRAELVAAQECPT
jgi:hypothetical protein